MSAERDIERSLGPWLEELAAPSVPDYFEAMIADTIRAPQRPWWRTVSGWLPAGPLVPGSLRGPVLALLLLAAALALAAFAGAIGRRPAMPIVDTGPHVDPLLARPWQPTPLEPTAELAAAVDEACSRALEGPGRAMPRVLLDVRGGHQVSTFHADGSEYAVCQLVMGADGSFDAATTWPTEEMMQPLNEMLGVEEPPRYGLMGSAGTEQGYGEYAGGRVAPTVATVRIVLVDGRVIEASVGGGYYFGWWPEDAPPVEAGSSPLTIDRVEGLNSAGEVMTGVNGWLLPDFRTAP